MAVRTIGTGLCSDAWEEDEGVLSAREWDRLRVGRPALGGGGTLSVAFKIDRESLTAVDAAARRLGMTRSAFVRVALGAAVESFGRPYPGRQGCPDCLADDELACVAG